jgi:hypothetical protein
VKPQPKLVYFFQFFIYSVSFCYGFIVRGSDLLSFLLFVFFLWFFVEEFFASNAGIEIVLFILCVF